MMRKRKLVGFMSLLSACGVQQVQCITMGAVLGNGVKDHPCLVALATGIAIGT